MENRYYELLRNASQDKFYEGVNNPEDELYDLVWDLFETVVIEPGEVFDGDFRDNNQFRYSINSGATLEFFPGPSYFLNRPGPDRNGNDAAGIHLRLSIQPYMSCLFSVGLRVWGSNERLALKKMWRQHRRALSTILRRSKPMIFTAVPFPSVEHASTMEEMLDNYFAVRDHANSLEFQYSFAQFDETDAPQNFMIYMTFLYHVVRDYCLDKEDMFDYWLDHVKEFFSGRLPDLPAPLPCVHFAITSDTE
ncbi:MAG: hypothetical protein HY645_01925 [Acidobacteria bacterium]|nr:hypothetical protein [Acidobacteriota bacterium]